MPQYQAPNPYPDFAEASDALVSQPTPSLQASGFTLNQRPSAANVNWLFRQLGRAARFFSQGINAAVQGATQELDWRLIGGGNWSWAASTGVLAWSETFSLAMPGLTDAANSCAAGSVTLTAGQVAYANCNAPFSTTGTLTSGSKTVSDLAFESGVVVGATVTGPGVPAGATVTAVSTSDSTITLSAAATSSSANTALVFATSGPLTVKAANTATFAPSSNTVVLARCVAVADMPNHVIVGLNAGVMLLRDGEQKRLLSTGYVSTFTALAGVDMPARTPIYISPGGFRDANRTAGFAFPLEAASTAARAAFAGITTSSVVSGSRVEIVGAGRVFYAAGNLLPGLTYYADPATPGNITATAPTAATQYVVPLGNALTANMLLVYSNALPAAQTPATFAYKSILDMGSYWSTNTGANFLPLRRLLFNETNAGLSAVPEARVMSHAGSVVAINIHANNSVNAATVLAVIKNGAQLVQQVVLPANTTDKSIPLTKGLYTFVAGDVLSARVMFGTDTGGGGVANVTGLNIALDATLTLEMTP